MYTLILVLFAVFIRNSYGEPVEVSHLVTMRKAELMAIINCVSDAKNPILCEKLRQCEGLMAKQITIAYEKCLAEDSQRETRECNTKEPLFPSPEAPSQIFDCIVRETDKLTPDERNEMVQFEECSRKLRDEYCKAS